MKHIIIIGICATLTANALTIKPEAGKEFIQQEHYTASAEDYSAGVLTVLTRVKFHPSAIEERGRDGLIMAVGNGWDNGFRMLAFPHKHGFQVKFSIGNQGKSVGVKTAKPIVAPMTWTHLAATLNNGQLTLYVNGEVVDTAQVPFTVKNAQPALLGQRDYGVGFYPFETDGVEILRECLSAAKIKELAGKPEVPDPAARKEQFAIFRMGAINFANETTAQLDEKKRYLPNNSIATRNFDFARADALWREGKSAEAAAILKNIAALETNELTHARMVAERALRRLSGDQSLEVIEFKPQIPMVVRNEMRAPLKEQGVKLFVAPNGNDANDGSQTKPFATLEKARDTLRVLKAEGKLNEGATVYLRGGTYQMKNSFVLESVDSGTEAAPILWCAYENEKPILTGALKVSEFKEVTDPAALARLSPVVHRHVRVADLSALKYPLANHRMPDYGFYAGENASGRIVDLYCDGEWLEPARTPNRSELTGIKQGSDEWNKRVTNAWFHVTQCVDSNNYTVTFNEACPEFKLWAKEPEPKATAFWNWHWADYTTNIKGFDINAKTITMGKLHISAPKKNYPFFFVNGLCGIDQPGEWFLDWQTGKLYLWPLKGTQHEYILPALGKPFIEVKQAQHFELRGLTFEYGCGTAIELKSCSNFTVAGNVIRNFGGDAMRISNAKQCTVRGNLMRGFSHGGMYISGGNRNKLEPSGIVIANNDISFVEQRKRTYAPGLHLSGCGTQVINNEFHDMRSSAMRLEGNDFWIASNKVYRCVIESDDQGGVDIWGNPSYAGIRIVHNLWRDIGCGGMHVPCGQAGVRFDDAISGMIVYGNLFDNCSYGHFGAVQMNGGRNNTVDNNVVINCRKGFSLGQWGNDRWSHYVANRTKRDDACITNAASIARYPYQKDLVTFPPVNYVTRNVIIGADSFRSGFAACANRVFDEMPTKDVLKNSLYYDPLPPISALGCGNDPFLMSAKKKAQTK